MSLRNIINEISEHESNKFLLIDCINFKILFVHTGYIHFTYTNIYIYIYEYISEYMVYTLLKTFINLTLAMTKTLTPNVSQNVGL